MPEDRVHDVSAMTDSELERARRHLMVSLRLAFPGSPVPGPILAHISAIDAELAQRANPPGQVTRTSWPELRWNRGGDWYQTPGHKALDHPPFCADHGVARQTAPHALHVLRDAGLVCRVAGLGYHVRNDRLSRLARGECLGLQPGSFKRVPGSPERKNGKRIRLAGRQGKRVAGRGLAGDVARPFRQAVLIRESARQGNVNR